MGTRHVVRRGECLSQIANRYGFADYKTLYNHPDNADLKKKRPNPNVLRPGDVIAVPDRDVKTVKVATGKVHKFTVKLPKKMLRLVILEPSGDPLKSEDYELAIGDETINGKTDGSGMIEVAIDAAARDGRVTIAGRILDLSFGNLNPVAPETDDPDAMDWTGVQARLKNLGYDTGPTDGQWGPRTRAAMALFQHDHDLEVDGKPADASLKKLMSAHGC